MIDVFDTSGLIEVSHSVRQADLWDMFDSMLELVENGQITFPSQVEKELARFRAPDIVGAWCARVKRLRVYPDPGYETVKRILRDPVVRMSGRAVTLPILMSSRRRSNWSMKGLPLGS